MILLATAYLPNVQYFSKLLSGHEVYIEVCNNYQKQSFRNRTEILGANGRQALVIPVKQPSGNRTQTREVMLDYDMPWHQVHWKSILAAYRHSPFFEFFEPEIAPLYVRKYKYLLDWNLMLLEKIFEMAGVSVSYRLTDAYVEVSDEMYDYREGIHPKPRLKQPDPFFEPVPYFQVFSNKHGFEANLSFIDLLFNEGPRAMLLCMNSYKKEAVK